MNELALDYLTNLLCPLKYLHSYPTRNEHLLQIPPCRTNALKQSSAYNAAICWDNLAKSFHNAPSLNSFKKMLCENLLKNKNS